ncbi:hypothetical protein BLNAU_5953 [Blattamonas nauphoetae]|uniref:Serine-threonine/tyrosine-protein kinase catalytic domain-containing protein n=1 Tax=Blattamonas nauphoetae TaxID=2049346 RepID=A0ABQ9Y5Y3_9EUKA|nr:hypothetical protein BLNAU_5953 [Blattamonas nauphoetae]
MRTTGRAVDLSTYLTQPDVKPIEASVHKEAVHLPQGVIFASWTSIKSQTLDIEGCNTTLIHDSDNQRLENTNDVPASIPSNHFQQYSLIVQTLNDFHNDWRDRLSPKARKGKGLVFGSNVKQTMSGCRVTNSTNPISGTGTMDANLGGSLFCLNTSFSSCERTSNTAIDRSYEAHVPGDRYTATDLSITAITFTLCSFENMTWGEEYGDFGGAAIFVRDTNAALTVTQCFFHNCTVTHESNDGGAISFYCAENNAHPLTITNSSFSDCASTYEQEHSTAGAFVALRQSQVSCSNCFCHKCSARGRGGGFYFITQVSVTLRNCAFVECESGTYGGGVLITDVKSLSFSFIQFRGCVAKGQGTTDGKDITIFGSDATVLNASSVLFCDSTSGAPNVLNHDTLTPILDLIPQVSAPTVTDCSVTLNGNEAVISVITPTAISGTMGVLLSGSNVPRLVHVEFGSPGKPSTAGKGITTAGLHGVLPSGVAYTRRADSLMSGLFPPTILSAAVSLDTTTEGTLQVKGHLLESGTYSIRTKDKDGKVFTFDMILTDSSTLDRTVQLSATNPDKLKYGAEYTVETVTCDSRAVLIREEVTFTVPYPSSALTSLAQVNHSDWTAITFQGAGFVAETYVVTLKEKDGDASSIRTVELSPSTENTLAEWKVVLFPEGDAFLAYGTQYEIVSATSKDTFQTVTTSGVIFETPAEPPRVLKLLSAVLTKDRKEVTLTLEGRALRSGLGHLWVTNSNQEWKSKAEIELVDQTHCKVVFAVGQSEDTNTLKYEMDYTICIAGGETSSVLVSSGIKVHVPVPPHILSPSFSFTNTLSTGCMISFSGSDLEEGKEYIVTLSSSFSFTIRIRNPTTACSDQMKIGWEDWFDFGQTYTITSITPASSEDGDVVFDPLLSVATTSKPSFIELHVDTEEGSESDFCGETSSPCRSIDTAWRIVKGMNFSKSTFEIQHNTTQSVQMVIGDKMEVVIGAGPTTEPELRVKQKEGLEGKGMIAVDGGWIRLNQVDVLIDTTDQDFIFISGKSGEVILRDCSISGSATETKKNEGSLCCEWESGVISVVDCSLTLFRSTFAALRQGAMNIKGGNVSIDGSIFRDNSADVAGFPSVRHNIGCSEEGELVVGSLNGGDGTPTDPSAWISVGDCSISGMEAIVSSPLFVPTLSSNSKSVVNKTTKDFVIEIVGKTLIPCGLFLKVSEITKLGEGNPTQIPLDLNTTISFNETLIQLTLPRSSLSPLNDSLEWRGRLVFGEGEETDAWFVVQKSASGRLAQSLLDNMKWWIPLVVGIVCLLVFMIVVLCLCFRRRRNQKKKEETQELSEHDDMVVKIDVEGTDTHQHNLIVSSADPMKDQDLTAHPPKPEEATKVMGAAQTPQKAVEVVKVLDCQNFSLHTVSKQNTLFNRLHVQKKPLSDRRAEEQRLAKALLRIYKTNEESPLLLKLTSHWILLNGEDRLCLEMPKDPLPSTNETQSVFSKGTATEVRPSFDQSATVRKEGIDEEGQRWQAPEQCVEEGEEPPTLNSEKVSVFRLGMVLWEIETELVPFGETDGVNAHRQLRTRVRLPMDRVGNAAMVELIGRCMSLRPDDRPKLETVISELESIEEEPDKEDRIAF